jgi:hypothetical protein
MTPNFAAPSIERFDLETLEQACIDDSHSQVTFSLLLEHRHITQRLFFALLDDRRQHGVAISVHPATGEVCDLSNDAGVIGYLSSSPLPPNVPVDCEVTLFKFGPNCVCSARIAGETFLYPAFTLPDCPRLSAIVGVESDNVRNGIGHSNVHLDVGHADLPQQVA